MAKEILIADADKADQKEFKKIFESTDYNLVFSDSGDQVLLRIKLFKPDLIIIGASLKEKKGLEVCKAVKADPESKHIPVILLSNILKGISEVDHKRLQADGVINMPFQEDETLNLVDRLMEEGEIKGKREGIIGREMEWKSVADFGKMNSEKKEEFLLDEVGETEDEEVIDLVDIVEEPELKMSIQDFVVRGKEAPLTEITPLESWEKLIEEDKPADRRSKFGPDENEMAAKGLSLQLGEEINLRKGVPEKELSEKIELEEILKKVEELAPEIEKEWPSEARQRVPEERRRVPEEGRRAPEAELPKIEEPPEKYTGLAEFEAALKKGLGEEPFEGEVRPSFTEKPTEKPRIEINKEIEVEIKEKPKMVAPKEFAPAELSLEEEIKEVLKELPEEVLEEELKEVEVEEEEFPRLLMEEFEKKKVGGIEKLKEERIDIFKEVGIHEFEKKEIQVIGKPEVEKFEIFEEVGALKVLKEEVRVFEKTKEEPMEIFEEIEIPEVEKEEVRVIGEPKEEPMEIFEEIEIPEVEKEEVRVIGEPKEERVEIFEEIEISEVEKKEIRVIGEPEEERVELFEERGAPEMVKEEVRVFEKPEEERLERIEEVTAPKVIAPEVTTPAVRVPIVQREEIIPPLRAVELQMEEVISQGVREMMEGFITKLVPEMTQNIINLTIERIERMVKEIVPELAEKMIQEEIKRLQKEEKD